MSVDGLDFSSDLDGFSSIFFTFRVSWIPKNHDSVWEWYTKPHFKQKPKKTRFHTDFVIVLRTIWDDVGDLWLTFGARGRMFFVFFRIDLSISFLLDFELPTRAPQNVTR